MSNMPTLSWPSLNIEWYEFNSSLPNDLEAKARNLLAGQPGWENVSKGRLFGISCIWGEGCNYWHCVAKFDMRHCVDGMWVLAE